MKRLWSLCCLLAMFSAPLAGADDDNDLKSAKIHTELAYQYFLRAQYGVALDEARIAIKAKRSYGPAYNTLAMINAELKEDDAAEEAFRDGLDYQPGDSDLNHNYGWFLCQRGRAKESIKYFRTALKNPLYASPEQALVSAGVCSMRAGDAEGANVFFSKALLIKPDYPPALWHLADESFKAGKPGDARRNLLRYHRVAGETAESLWLGVRIERRLGDKDAEMNYANKLKQQFPESGETAEMLNGQP